MSHPQINTNPKATNTPTTIRTISQCELNILELSGQVSQQKCPNIFLDNGVFLKGISSTPLNVDSWALLS